MTTRPRIGFDLSPLAQPSSAGVRRATRELWRALARRRGALEWLPVGADTSVGPPWWRQVAVPRLVGRLALRGWHATVSALPWFARCTCVQTVHEVPWRSGAGENAGVRHRAWARSRRAAATIVPSRTTAELLTQERGGRADGIHVVPWGVGAPFTLDHGERPRGGARRVVLVGGTRPKKRLDLALEVLQELTSAAGRGAARDVELWVTGRADAGEREWLAACERRAAELRLGERLVLAGDLGDAALARLVHGAAAVLIVSASEGFGLPALEAAALGTPSVVRSGGAAAEAAGPGAFPFTGSSADAARALAEALDCDEAERTDLRSWALAHTWDASAEQVEALWGTLLR